MLIGTTVAHMHAYPTIWWKTVYAVPWFVPPAEEKPAEAVSEPKPRSATPHSDAVSRQSRDSFMVVRYLRGRVPTKTSDIEQPVEEPILFPPQNDGGYVEVPDLPSLGPTPPPSPPTPLVIAVAREASRRGRHAPTVSIPLDVDSSPSAYTPGGSERLSFPPPPLPPKGRSQPDGNNGFSTQSNPPQYAQPMPPPLAARVNQDSQPADKNVSYAQPRPSQYPQPRVRVNLDDDDDGFYAAPRAAPSLTRRASQTRRMSTFMQK
ncbi:hypothetical protein HWV62_1609, partial [Athelia sp. TMB]